MDSIEAAANNAKRDERLAPRRVLSPAFLVMDGEIVGGVTDSTYLVAFIFVMLFSCFFVITVSFVLFLTYLPKLGSLQLTVATLQSSSSSEARIPIRLFGLGFSLRPFPKVSSVFRLLNASSVRVIFLNMCSMFARFFIVILHCFSLR